VQPLGDPQRCKRFARAAGHDELAAIMVSKPVDDGLDRSGLVGSCIPPRQPRGCSPDLNGPVHFFRQEVTTEDQPHRLLLAVKRSAGCGADVVRRGQQESIVRVARTNVVRGGVFQSFFQRKCRYVNL
jgi:hypothetical protein